MVNTNANIIALDNTARGTVYVTLKSRLHYDLHIRNRMEYVWCIYCSDKEAKLPMPENVFASHV